MSKRLWTTSVGVAAGLLVASTPALASADPGRAPAAVTTATDPSAAATAAPATADLETAELSILARTNALRAGEGTAPLVRDAAMDGVAAAWAAHLATTGEFRHNPAFAQQIPAGWRTAGENIAMNSWDPVELSTQWESSPGHRANIVDPAFTHIGIAVVEHGGLYYGVQVFGGY